MTYDDCEAFEAQQAEERAGRLYARYALLWDCSREHPEGAAYRLRLEALLPRLAELEEGEEVETAPIYRELGEIRRALGGTGDMRSN